MLCQSLSNLYETLLNKGKVDKPGWCKLGVSYGLKIDEDGQLKEILSLKNRDDSGKKEVAVSLSVPEHGKRSSGILANFLCDTSSYIFGYEEKNTGGNKDDSRALNCFKACKDFHLTIFKNRKSEAINSIMNYFDNWKPENTKSELIRLGCDEKTMADIISKGANLIFMPMGKLATDYDDICQLWDNREKPATSKVAICSVTGKKLSVARLHPPIKGVKDAQSMGASLVSFNSPAFESYGKEQGFNGPVSEYVAFAYTTALNYLLTQKKYVTHFGDATVVCWTEDDSEACQDIFTRMFGGDNDRINQSELSGVIKKLAEGKSVDWKDIPVNPKNRFYILGLSPNAARLSVRFFLNNTFGEFMKNALAHEERMKIVAPSYEIYQSVPAWKALLETVNKNSKNKSAKPQLAGNYMYSILTNTRYPETLYNNIIIRINAEHNINYTKASIIKAYLIKNYKEELKVKLDNECTNKAYLLGRLFSLLEEIQSAANPGINTTIRDRYFTSVSSTPALVFPTLIDLSQKHLRKIKGNTAAYISLNKRFTELIAMLNEEFPARLTLQEKGIFQIGYYHQTQNRFTSKEDK